MFEGYLCVGGTEIGNNARARGYAESADCPVDWFVCDQCEGLADAVGDEGYVLADISEAPWFDPDDESTSRFYGAYIVSLGEVSSSTRFGNYTEGIVDGGVPGRSRHTGKTFRVRAWLTADGEDALEVGQGWLDAALEANTCGTHSGGTCGASDATFFTACPPLRGLVPGFSPWVQEAENLFTTPDFEAGSGTVEVQRNLAYDPGSTSSASFGGFAGTGNTGMGEIAPSAWSISGDAYRRTWTTRPNADGAVGYRIGSLGFTPDELFTIVVRFQVSHPSRVSVGPGGAAGTGRVLGASSPAIDAVPGVTYTHWMTASWTTVGADTRISLTAGDSSRVDGYWIEVGDALAYPGEYDASRLHFVPGYPSPDPDLTPSWTGAENASESVLRGVSAKSFTLLGDGKAYLSSGWSASGSTSLKMVGSPINNSSQRIVSDLFSVTPGELYTVMGTINMPDGIGGIGGYPRSLQIRDSGGGILGDSGPVSAGGVTNVRYTFTPTAASIRFWLDMRSSSGTWFWDNLAVVKGDYTGPWFSGDTEDTDLERYRWTGTPNNSSSLYDTRDAIERMQTDEEYEATVAPLVRHMHDVICISGPLEIETRRSRDGIHWGRLVEFTLYAGKPWLYGETKRLDLSPTPATVVQDIPYNLIPTPSAELPGDPVVVATNYSLNPSLEANATGWTVNFSSWSGDDPVSRSTSGRVTGELAAAGVASMRTRLLGDATAASGRAQHSVSQMVDITGRPNDARMSATIWGALINVGAATGTTLRRLHAHCDWYNASNVVIDSVLLGDIVDEGAFGGHVFSQKSMMPPAAATQALITVTGEFDWSSGTNKSDIRLYVDALALTVP